MGWELREGEALALLREILDPFAGSGSTGVGALLEGRSFLGIERESAYCEIARARLAEAERRVQTTLPLAESA